MTEVKQNLLSALVLISKIDASLARLEAQRTSLESEITGHQAALKKAQLEQELKDKLLADKKARLQREEKSLKEEQEKLVARRKALTTFSNYKLQQAAEREIDHASRQLRVREEALLGVLEENEKLEEECKALASSTKSLTESLNKLTQEAKEAFSVFAGREKEYKQERAELVTKIDAAALAMYERIRERHPCDAVVAVKGQACAGCYIQVAPQLIVEIARGDTLVKCRGCGRILYLEEDPGSDLHKASNGKSREE